MGVTVLSDDEMEIVNQPNKDEVNSSVISLEVETDNDSLVSINEKPVAVDTPEYSVENTANSETEVINENGKSRSEEINEAQIENSEILYHRDLVSVPLGRLIQICNRLMTK